eukprot:TRINITY_DN14289_c0_g1_i1.p1 TRINITY_DN14289_c0_g1~~TRINITY_DN14289_c0_g1_i1.p1  ORF type:complete len:530 (-),score=111.80 TRINITY_DN14289_c0_g1_i1:73-1662(-)
MSAKAGVLVFFTLFLLTHSLSATSFDVVIYGATPSGILAAVASAREGLSVLLFEPLNHLGGMVSGGLGNTDIGNPTVIGGTTLKFFELIGQQYDKSGPVWHFEPHVASKVFNDLITQQGTLITVALNTTLISLHKEGTRITSLQVSQNSQVSSTEIEVTGSVFIDASYAGDLLYLSGVSYAWGRESTQEYSETLAGRLSVPTAYGDHQFSVAVDPHDAPGKLSPLVYGGDPGQIGAADKKVQSYNFRLCFSSDPNNQVPFPKPQNYDPTYWNLLKRYIQIHGGSIDDYLIFGGLPNKKFDINNKGPISTDVIGKSWDYPLANATHRQAIWQEHIDYTQSFLYFLAHDSSVPSKIRDELNKYGLCADEFTSNNNWPPQLYIRESLRMKGKYIFTQKDRERDLRKNDTIGMGSYNVDTHNAQRIPQGSGTVTEGDVEMKYFENFEMPYSIMLPKETECENMLVSVCLSASHIGYGPLRLEPQYMILGESAGLAAAMAVKENAGKVANVKIIDLQKKLLSLNQILSQNDWAF